MSQLRLIEFNAVGEVASGEYSGAIGVVESLEANQVIEAAKISQLSHIVQKTGLAYERELEVANTMSENLSQFMDQPLQTILGTHEAMYPTCVVSNEATELKAKTLAEFEEFLKGLPGTRRIRESAMMMADELYTNATKAGGHHKLRSASQSQRDGTIEFFASADSTRLVLGCRDSYGDLAFGQVLNRIHNCFQNGIANSINNGEGGAGIGSFMVFNACISYYCGVEKGKRTVVCVALPLGTKTDADSLPKNIHLRAA